MWVNTRQEYIKEWRGWSSNENHRLHRRIMKSCVVFYASLNLHALCIRSRLSDVIVYLGCCKCHDYLKACALEMSAYAANMVTLKFVFLGHFSKEPSQMETFSATVLHLCQLPIPITENSQTQVCQTDQEKEVRLFVSHHLKYLLPRLRVTFHIQGLNSIKY